MSVFRFKQFEINQDKSAMKVGTDGVLLGAWANLSDVKSILDIGAGTGLISLMSAQLSTAQICAVEIDKDAFEQCSENITKSKWKDRISVFNTPIQKFDYPSKFDLIISNPPFFQNSLKTENSQKNLARHTDSLSFDELLKQSYKLLTSNGKANYIIPFDSESEFLDIASSYNLHPSRIAHVKGNIDAPVKRSLIELQFTQKKEVEKEEITIEISRHVYTEKYINLTREFYLKM